MSNYYIKVVNLPVLIAFQIIKLISGVFQDATLHHLEVHFVLL